MVRADKKTKLRAQKNKPFLGLIKKYRSYEFNQVSIKSSKYGHSFTFLFFKQHYRLIINIFYIYDLLKSWKFIKIINCSQIYNLLRYYAETSYFKPSTEMALVYKNSLIRQNNNVVVFSRPKKQIYLTFFKSKPIFIFTGGLMRKVMNEKRKSSKKLYKVSISLIKLFTILLSKRNFFPQGYLKLINIGNLRVKILSNLFKVKKYTSIYYVIIKFRIDFTSQKLETRRAIKKYVKKRFKVR